jgi:NAD(P)-dependent dehydrogenase (short-subunit alcohol dehydrogenase family)
MGRLDGKVALISGGAKGQGATETRLFVREGARVVFGDVLDAEGKAVEAEIRAAGGEATFVHLDVTREADWRAAVATAVERYGKLDVLVNNAGILMRAKIEDTSEADWDRIMAVNVKGVFLGTKCALPAMRKAGGGSIVNISSVLGLRGASYAMAYCASKGAVRSLTKNVAMHCAQMKYGIRCNSVHPGYIDTPMIAPRLAGTIDNMTGRQWLEALHPLGRLGRAEEVATMILFLLSDESGFSTGSEFVCDGGLTA